MTDKKTTSSARIITIALTDIVLVMLSFLLSYICEVEKGVQFNKNPEYYIFFGLYIALWVFALWLFRGYKKATVSNHFINTAIVFLSSMVTHTVFVLFFLLFNIKDGFDWMLFSSVLSALLLSFSRILHKVFFDRWLIKYSADYNNQHTVPTLIIGAGFTGKLVYREILDGGDSNLMPVCFVDDNKDLISTTVCGLNVYGPTVLLPELCKKHRIGMVVFAIPSCDADNRDRILSYIKDLPCEVRIVPSLSELTQKKNYFKQSQSIDLNQLLGRDAIDIKNKEINEFICGKNCLVTGGGGSIGSELCRQIVKMNPNKLVIVDIYENNAYEIQQELKRKGYGEDKVSVEIASVRDIKKMRILFNKYKFNVVFHAAAHKHVPLMETNPEEAIKNNVMGTYNVAHLCHRFKTQKMVLISTDKAVNPTNVMGASKRVCEMIMQYMAQRHNETSYSAVRFGNVLGSNGSVIPLFIKQIESGGPVTVTHPDIVRYFMTIPEAVSLVLEASTMAKGSETFVLDMGEPVKIVTLAENIIKIYGYQPYTEMPITFCGLREGEKLYEELLMNEENLKKTHNQKIFISQQLEINCEEFFKDLEEIIAAAQRNDAEQTVNILHKLVDTFKPPEVVNREAISKREKTKA